MKLEITGTREGMNRDQQKNIAFILKNHKFSELHHGDCMGVDDEVATMAYLYVPTIVCHPPIDTTHQAFNKNYKRILKTKTHFARNRDIVDETDLLIVVPKQNEHQSFGGTWYTHDYAEKKGKRIVILWPNGSITGRVSE